MIIKTKNVGGRAIKRVDAPSHWHYQRTDHNPAICARLTGVDGKTYAVQLDAADLHAIDVARKQFAEHLDENAESPKFGSKP